MCAAKFQQTHRHNLYPFLEANKNYKAYFIRLIMDEMRFCVSRKTKTIS